MSTAKVSIVELAKHFKVSRQTIYNWRDAGAPIGEGIEALGTWRSQRVVADSSLQESRLRCRIAVLEQDAKLLRLKNEIATGELWPADEVLSVWRQAIAILAARLQTIPEQIANDLPAGIQGPFLMRADSIMRQLLGELELTSLPPPLSPEPNSAGA